MINAPDRRGFNCKITYQRKKLREAIFLFAFYVLLHLLYMYMYITDTLNSDDTARSRKYRLVLKYFNINLTPVKVLNASLP